MPAAHALGFNPERLAFSFRTALASCAALVIAWLMELEHPQWAAMTVFAAAQPSRNMLVEKSFFRAAGTVIGSVIGVLLILASGSHQLLLVAGLAAWIGICAFLGNVLRGFLSYGTILAGYTAAMVALLETAHPGHIFALGADRALTVLTGVLVGLIVGLLFTPKEAPDELAGRVRQLSARLLRAMADRVDGHSTEGEDWHNSTLSEIAVIDELLDPHGAGSLRSRRSARTLRAVLAAHVSALLWMKGRAQPKRDPALGRVLARAADAHEGAASPAEIAVALEEAAALAADRTTLHAVIERMRTALLERASVVDRHSQPADESELGKLRLLHPVILHQDWIGARQAAIRATAILLLIGVVWILTGWSSGAYVMLGTSVMISLFSTFENPAQIMRQIFQAQLCGAIAALACRWLVWPHATSEFQLVLMIMPFVLTSIIPLSLQRPIVGGTDYVLILLLLSQPAFPLTGSFGQSFATATAVVLAPMIALISFRLIFPTDAHRRLNTLIAMMVHDLERMAAARDATSHQVAWRSRLYHRLIRLVRWADRSAERELSPAEGGMAVYSLGASILSMRELAERGELSAGTTRAITIALRRIERVSLDPARASAALERAAERVAHDGGSEAALLQSAARAIDENRPFFVRARRGAARKR
ncbi:FUSC family protein [Sinorhizobium sp. BG8]|uniref:FUSC family protein n=1 Tax=Sinorhizobium sp. BG8 TaxID=2613773 RepID=UPI001FEF4D8B|nr:FUSC family protein [Sinorhizobium sp. BG8]